MEKRTFTNILITLAVLALIPIGLFIFSYLQNQYIDWNERYQVDNKQPYNNYMVFNLLKNYNPEKEFVFIEDVLTEKLAEDKIKEATTPMSYVFVGPHVNLLDDEIDSLRSFVEKGNTAFFAVNILPDTLLLLLGLEYDNYSYSYDSLISTNFFNSAIEKQPSFTFNYRRKNESVGTSWNYFSSYDIENSEKRKAGTQYNSLGYIKKLTDLQQYATTNYDNYGEENYSEDYYDYQEDELLENKENNYNASEEVFINFIRIKYGKGYFYFHRNPVLFTNYYLIQEDGKKYAERVLSYLPEGDILWDERSHFYKRGKREYQKQAQRPSPLSYILSQPAFAWGYYLLFVAALLFVIFRGKRMQRIIPILRKEENTSLEFTKTVGQLYYLQKDHKRLTQLKIRLFFDFIRTKYHMNTQHIDDDFRKKLSERSGMSREFVDLILSDIQKVNGQYEVSEWLLRKIHTQIQEFYTNCK